MADKTVSVRLIARVGQYASEMNSAAGATSSFSQHLTGAAGKAQGAVTKLGTAAALAGKITLLGIGAAMVVSAKAAIDFESSLTGVAKTTNLAGEDLAAFGRTMRDLSLDIPVNVNELNRIAELGGQLGIAVPQLEGFTRTIAMLGVTTNLSTEEAATGLARFINVMGASQSDVGRFGSIIVELGNNFATTEQEILHFALRLAPIGKTVGISEAGVLAMGTALSSLGITAERGSTAIQRTFLEMAEAVQTGGDSLDSLAMAAGVSAEQFSDAFRRDPVEALILLSQGLGNVVDAGGNVFGVLEDLGIRESRQIGVTLALAEGVDLLADAYDKATAEAEENNALYEEAALRFGTTESQIGLLANAFNDLRIEVGNAFLDTGALSNLITLVKEFLLIMRDNVDVMRIFALVAGTLSMLALINFFAILATKGLEAAHGMGRALRAADGLGKGLVFLRNTSATLNIAFGAVGIAATILGAIWLNQAAKAARLKQAVEELNTAIESGEDPLVALGDQLRESLDIATIERLQTMGISVQDLANDIASGGSLLEDVMAGASTEVDRLGGSLGGLAAGNISKPELIRFIEDLGSATGETAAVIDLFRREQLADFVDDFRAINPETKLTTEQIREMGKRIQDLHGADLSGWAEDVTANMNFLDPAARRAKEQFASLAGVIETDVTPTFLQHLLALDDGGEAYEGFVNDVSEAVETFRETISEEFQNISDSLRDGIPAWDEYGEAAVVNIRKILGAREAHLRDMRAWAEAQPLIVATASNATLAEMDAWTSQEKGAFGRLNDQRQTELIRGMNEGNAEIAKLTRETFQTRLPRIVRDAAPELVGAIMAISDAIIAENPGMDVGDAWAEGVTLAIQDFTDDPVLQQELEAYLTDPSMLANVSTWAGGIGEFIIAGLIVKLSQLGDRAAAVMAAQMEQVENQVRNTIGAQSPAQKYVEVAEDVVAGFELGLHRSFRQAKLGLQLGAMIQPSISRRELMGAASVTSSSSYSTSTSSSNVTISMPIVNPESKDLNRAVEKGRLKIKALVPMIERNWRIR